MGAGTDGYGTSVGDRVRLLYVGDEHTKLRPGDTGTVRLIDGLGTVFVDWDSGSKLGLIRSEGDTWEVIRE